MHFSLVYFASAVSTFKFWKLLLSVTVASNVLISNAQFPWSQSRLPAPRILEHQAAYKRHRLYVTNSTLWKSPIIPVCWENPSERFQGEQEFVEKSIKESWGAYSDLKFSCWHKCSSLEFYAIRIRVADDWPRANFLGSRLEAARNGIVLNFDFSFHGFNHCKMNLTARKDCIRDIAVHEFGHAIGFAHEQNRPDNPDPRCREASQGPDGDYMITAYDLSSIMNYCKPLWKRNGTLSLTDREGLQVLYGSFGRQQQTRSSDAAAIRRVDWEGSWNCSVDGHPAILELRVQSKNGKLVGRAVDTGRPFDSAYGVYFMWASFNENSGEVADERAPMQLLAALKRSMAMDKSASRTIMVDKRGITFLFNRTEEWALFMHTSARTLISGYASINAETVGISCERLQPVDVCLPQSLQSLEHSDKPTTQRPQQKDWEGSWSCQLDGVAVVLNVVAVNSSATAVVQRQLTATLIQQSGRRQAFIQMASDNEPATNGPKDASTNFSNSFSNPVLSIDKGHSVRFVSASSMSELTLYLHRQNPIVVTGFSVENGKRFGVRCVRDNSENFRTAYLRGY